MRCMFQGCMGLTTLNVSKWNTSKVTDMSYMFNVCKTLASLDVTNFDTSNVTDMSYMFNGCTRLTTIGPVDTASCWQHKPDKYNRMFENCHATPKPTWYAAA